MPIVELPSPQVISYLFGFPTVVIVSVTTNPAPPTVLSAVKSTDLTKVLFLTFSSASFKSSIESVTVCVSVNVDIAPTGNVDESVGPPNTMSLPFVTFVPPAPAVTSSPLTYNFPLTFIPAESLGVMLFTVISPFNETCNVELDESPADPDVVIFVPSPTTLNSSFAVKFTVITEESSPENCNVFVDTTRSQTDPVHSQVLSAIVCLSPTLGELGKLAGIVLVFN